MRIASCSALLSAALLLPIAVPLAQEAARPITKFTADFGYVQTSGNTEVTTTNAGERLTWQSGRFTVSQGFALVYGKQRDTVTTNNIRTSLRTDYRIDKVFAFFVGAAFDRDKFAGIEKRFEEIIGLQAIALAGARDTVRVEGGGSITQQIPVAGMQQNFPSARAAGSWRHVFSTASYFQQNLEIIPNLQDTEDWRINTEFQVVAPLSSMIGVKLSYVIRYDNLPQPGFSTTDRLFTTGVQLTF
jgi:putative salt-induced outer membrane protein YdiY